MSSPPPDQRQGHHVGSRGQLLAGSRAVLGDLAAELVAENDALARAHEVLVADMGHHVGQLVAAMAGVEIGSADSTAQHLQQHLPLGRLGGGEVIELQLSVPTGDGLHALTSSRRGLVSR